MSKLLSFSFLFCFWFSGITQENPNVITSFPEQQNVQPATTDQRISADERYKLSLLSYRDFKIQLKAEKESMLVGNQKALDAYRKYKKQNIIGWAMLGGGYAVTTITSISVFVNPLSSLNTKYVVMVIGGVVGTVGLGVLLFNSLEQTYYFYNQAGGKQAGKMHFDFYPMVDVTPTGENAFGMSAKIRF